LVFKIIEQTRIASSEIERFDRQSAPVDGTPSRAPVGSSAFYFCFAMILSLILL
jgi:hypothetical protein